MQVKARTNPMENFFIVNDRTYYQLKLWNSKIAMSLFIPKNACNKNHW